MLDKDKESFAEDLKKLISTENLKIIIIPNKTTKYEFDMEGLHSIVYSMSIQALDAGDASKVVHHYCRQVPKFIGSFPNPDKLNNHPLMQ